MKKVLVTCKMANSFLKGLSRHFIVDHKPEITDPEVDSIIHEYEGIVISTRIAMDQARIDLGRSLKFIARAGSGMENIDVEYAGSKHIFCINSPEGNSNAVAEHAIGMLLALLNNITLADKEVRQEIWLREQNRGHELSGKTVGVIGYGHTGSSFAKKLRCFDCEIIVYDKYKKGIAVDGVEEVGMEDIFRRAEVVSLHIPLTKETRGMVDAGFIEKFVNNIYLINTSRGKIFKTSELIPYIRSGRIKGACLDVLENEDISEGISSSLPWFNELTKLNNVILTPHVAGWSYESKEKIGQVLLQKIMGMSSGS